MKLVIGVDGSDHSLRALKRALQLADLFDAELHVVHVVHLPASLLGVLSRVPADLDAFETVQRKMVWEATAPVLEASGRDVVKVDLNGYPPDTLVDYAKEQAADMIVVGSRGRGELAALMLGSTSHRIVHLASCDVLVVKGPCE